MMTRTLKFSLLDEDITSPSESNTDSGTSSPSSRVHDKAIFIKIRSTST